MKTICLFRYKEGWQVYEENYILFVGYMDGEERSANNVSLEGVKRQANGR